MQREWWFLPQEKTFTELQMIRNKVNVDYDDNNVMGNYEYDVYDYEFDWGNTFNVHDGSYQRQSLKLKDTSLKSSWAWHLPIVNCLVWFGQRLMLKKIFNGCGRQIGREKITNRNLLNLWTSEVIYFLSLISEDIWATNEFMIKI